MGRLDKWHWSKRRHGRVGRPPKPIAATSSPVTEKLEPTPQKKPEPIYLEPAEVEALRLIDLENLSFEEASARMRFYRNAIWRLVENAGEKLVRTKVEAEK